tara:strand:- start:310 stop:861 length:552 start_codon:yes stop_codon:yes gene_type:complete
MSGSNYSGGSSLQTGWSTTNNTRAVGQTNLVASTSNEFYITGTQLVAGSYPDGLPFMYRSYGEELALCQRYYQNLGRESTNVTVFVGMVRNGHSTFGHQFPVKMRAEPSVTPYGGNSTTGNYNVVTATSSVSQSADTMSVDFIDEEGIRFRQLNTGTGYNGQGVYVDVGTAATQVGFEFDAEL